MELSEVAQESISPTSSFSRKTHPSAHERLEYLLKNAKIPKDFDMKEIHKIQDNAKWLKEVLIDDISLNYDHYDIYGSAYLDEPNTEWRGKRLIDRVDYY